MRRVSAVAAALLGCGRIGFGVAGSHDGPANGSNDAIDGAGAAHVRVSFYETMMSSAIQTVPIAPVDPASTLVLCEARTSASGADRSAVCRLDSASSVVVQSGTADPLVVVHVQVVELAGANVQRGQHSFSSSSALHAQPILPVDLGAAFPIVTSTGFVGSASQDHLFDLAAYFADATTLEIQRSATGDTVELAWQVVEIAGAVVRSGRTTVANGATSASATIVPVDRARAFVVSSARTGNGVEADRLAHVTLAADDTLSFTRNGSTTTVEVAWFVVELPAISVQRGELGVPNELLIAQDIVPVERSRAISLLSVSGGLPADANASDVTAFTTRLTATQLELQRGDRSSAPVTASWSVVEWAAQ